MNSQTPGKEPKLRIKWGWYSFYGGILLAFGAKFWRNPHDEYAATPPWDGVDLHFGPGWVRIAWRHPEALSNKGGLE